MRVALLMVVAGCYGPKAQSGAPCASDGTCPTGLECRGGTCVLPGELLDAPVIDVDAEPDALFLQIDAAVDAYVPDAFVDTTLIAHWKFDDSPANGALDSTGRNHDGTCAGTACPTLAAGHIGNSYQFDAVDDVLVAAVIRWRAPVNENGRDGAYEKVRGASSLATGRPPTNGRVTGRRGPSFSDLSILRGLRASGPSRVASGVSPTSRGSPKAGRT